MSVELKFYEEGVIRGKSPKMLLIGTFMGESLRKLFCEGLAFKTGQPFACCPLPAAFKAFS